MKISDAVAKIDLILEIYTLLWWKRNKSKKMFLQVCSAYSNENMSFSWEGKVKALINKMKTLEKNQIVSNMLFKTNLEL